jgi:hypothetical protein
LILGTTLPPAPAAITVRWCHFDDEKSDDFIFFFQKPIDLAGGDTSHGRHDVQSRAKVGAEMFDRLMTFMRR